MQIARKLTLPPSVCALVALTAVSHAAAGVYYVRADGNDTNPGNGSSPAVAWATLAHAITVAAVNPSVTEIRVARSLGGHFETPLATTTGSYVIGHPMKIIGGCDETTPLFARAPAQRTEIRGAIPGTGVSLHIFDILSGAASSEVRIEGFDIKDGDATAEPTPIDRSGGAIRANGGATAPSSYYAGPLVVADCVISGCAATSGGAIALDGWNCKVRDCAFTANVAVSTTSGGGLPLSPWGGAISARQSRIEVCSSTFEGNYLAPAPTIQLCGGGAIGLSKNDFTVLTCSNCLFANNTAHTDLGAGSDRGSGGAIFADVGIDLDSSGDSALRGPILINCSFRENSSGDRGGAVFARDTTEVAHCTFAMNASATSTGGALFVATRSSSNPVALITNTIMWNNDGYSTSLQERQLASDAGVFIDARYCCVQATAPLSGPGNINADPLFGDADLHLHFDSPARATGSTVLLSADLLDVDDDASTTMLPLDLDRLPRVMPAAGIDMGAFQFTCEFDLNHDGLVDGADLGVLFGSFGTCSHCMADLNDDGLVNGADLGALLGFWAEGEDCVGPTLVAERAAQMERLMGYLGVSTVTECAERLMALPERQAYEIVRTFMLGRQ